MYAQKVLKNWLYDMFIIARHRNTCFDLLWPLARFRRPKEALGCKNKAVSSRIDLDKVRHKIPLSKITVFVAD